MLSDSRTLRTGLLFLTVLMVGVACGGESIVLTSIPISTSAPLPPVESPSAVLPATPTQWPTPTNQAWRTIALGVERRDVDVFGPHFRFPATVHLVRLDPAHVKIHTHYSPEVPITISDWQRETQAMLVVNGGFFTPAKRSEGLMVSFGQPYGATYRQGGMFYIQNGQPGLRALVEEPYKTTEQFEEAMQAYPVLMSRGGQAARSLDDQRFNRRTAVGIDKLGRVVLLVIDEPVVSLRELGQWLAVSDLELDMALNLDGGSSSGMAVATDSDTLMVDSHGPVPIVIAAYP